MAGTHYGSDDLLPMFRAIHPAAWRANAQDVDITPRLAAADLLQELDRPEEAAILADPSKHAYLGFGGQVQDAGNLVRQLKALGGPRGMLDNFTMRYIQYLLDESHSPGFGEASYNTDVDYGTMAAMVADAEHFRALHEGLHPRVGHMPTGEQLQASRHYPEARRDAWFAGRSKDYDIHNILHDYAWNMGPFHLTRPEGGKIMGSYFVPDPDAVTPPPEPNPNDFGIGDRPNDPPAGYERESIPPEEPVTDAPTTYADEATVTAMLAELADRKHGNTRWGTQAGDRNFRNAVADALRDVGRDQEADLLQSGRQVIITPQGVRPGIANVQGVLDTVRRFGDRQIEHGLIDPQFGNPSDYLRFEARPNGQWALIDDFSGTEMVVDPHEIPEAIMNLYRGGLEDMYREAEYNLEGTGEVMPPLDVFGGVLDQVGQTPWEIEDLGDSEARGFIQPPTQRDPDTTDEFGRPTENCRYANAQTVDGLLLSAPQSRLLNDPGDQRLLTNPEPGRGTDAILDEQPVTYRDEETIDNFLKELWEGSNDATLHGAFADTLDEWGGAGYLPNLIRRQFGVGEHAGNGPLKNNHYNEINHWWHYPSPLNPNLLAGLTDAPFVGNLGPLDLHLRREDIHHTAQGSENPSASWILHAVSRRPGSQGFGYSFEFPHGNHEELKNILPWAGQILDDPQAWENAVTRSTQRQRQEGPYADTKITPEDMQEWFGNQEEQPPAENAMMEEPVAYMGADDDTLKAMLQALSLPEHNATRWGQGDNNLRAAVADALRDRGRDQEADLVQSGSHVILSPNGEVREGRFTTDNILASLMDLDDFMESMGLDSPDSRAIGFDLLDNNRMRINHGFAEPREVGIHEAGGLLADAIDSIDNDWTLVEPEAQEAYQELLDQLRNAPFEDDIYPPPGSSNDDPDWARPEEDYGANCAPTEYGPYEDKQRLGFETSLQDNPWDSTGHKVYADWLEEQGEPQQAAMRRGFGDYVQQRSELNPDVNQWWERSHGDRAMETLWNLYHGVATNLSPDKPEYVEPQPIPEDWGAYARYGAAEDEQAFRSQIAQNPFELTSHAAFADWLGDQGRDDDAQMRQALLKGMERRKDTKWIQPSTDWAGTLEAPAPHGPGYLPQEEVWTPPSRDHGEKEAYLVSLVPELVHLDDPTGWSWGYKHFSGRNADMANLDHELGIGPDEDNTEFIRTNWRRAHGGGPLAGGLVHPHESAFHGLSDIYNLDPQHWAELERLFQRQWGRGKKNFEDDVAPSYYSSEEDPTNYGFDKDALNSYLRFLAENPTDLNARGTFADWLEEYAPHLTTQKTLDFLRKDQRDPAWVQQRTPERSGSQLHWPEGRILAGRAPSLQTLLDENADQPTYQGNETVRNLFTPGRWEGFPGTLSHGPGGDFFTARMVGDPHGLGTEEDPYNEPHHAAWGKTAAPNVFRPFAMWSPPFHSDERIMRAAEEARWFSDRLSDSPEAEDPPVRELYEDEAPTEYRPRQRNWKVGDFYPRPQRPAPTVPGPLANVTPPVKNSYSDEPVQYNHDAFHQAIGDNPTDMNHRWTYLDWLMENDPEALADPAHADLLGNHQGPVWIRRGHSGKIHAGVPFNDDEMWRVHQSSGRELPQNAWLHGEPIYGPGGTHHVIEERPDMWNLDGTPFPPIYTVRSYDPVFDQWGPEAPKIGSQPGDLTYHHTPKQALETAEYWASLDTPSGGDIPPPEEYCGYSMDEVPVFFQRLATNYAASEYTPKELQDAIDWLNKNPQLTAHRQRFAEWLEENAPELTTPDLMRQLRGSGPTVLGADLNPLSEEQEGWIDQKSQVGELMGREPLVRPAGGGTEGTIKARPRVWQSSNAPANNVTNPPTIPGYRGVQIPRQQPTAAPTQTQPQQPAAPPRPGIAPQPEAPGTYPVHGLTYPVGGFDQPQPKAKTANVQPGWIQQPDGTWSLAPGAKLKTKEGKTPAPKAKPSVAELAALADANPSPFQPSYTPGKPSIGTTGSIPNVPIGDEDYHQPAWDPVQVKGSPAKPSKKNIPNAGPGWELVENPTPSSRYFFEDLPVNYASRHSLPTNPGGYRLPVYQNAPFGMRGYWGHFLVPSPNPHPETGRHLWTMGEGQPLHFPTSGPLYEWIWANTPHAEDARDVGYFANWKYRMDEKILRELSDHEMFDSGLWNDPDISPLYAHLRENPGDVAAREALVDLLQDRGFDPYEPEGIVEHHGSLAERIRRNPNYFPPKEVLPPEPNHNPNDFGVQDRPNDPPREPDLP